MHFETRLGSDFNLTSSIKGGIPQGVILSLLLLINYSINYLFFIKPTHTLNMLMLVLISIHEHF